MGIIDDWGLSLEDLNAILSERPSARGPLIGFVSEYKLQRGIFSDARIHKLRRYDDHDRTRPADFSFEYQGEEISVEVKSLQTNSVRRDNGGYVGRCQVDASDRRKVTLPDGSVMETTCLLPGKFDILAVSLFEFGQKWRFAFIRNEDLPRSRHRGYSAYQRENLLATSIRLTWPLEPPFEESPFPLLEAIARERASKRNSETDPNRPA